MEIVSVQFKSKFDDTFAGREYSYFVKDGITLKEGDIVKVPTSKGDGVAKVKRTRIADKEVENIRLLMKIITQEAEKEPTTEGTKNNEQ